MLQEDTLEGNDAMADMSLLAIHEVGHALGFTVNLLKYFRDPETGEPMTPRPFQPSAVTCVDRKCSESSISSNKYTRHAPVV